MPLHSLSIIFIRHCLFGWRGFRGPPFSRKPTIYERLPRIKHSNGEWNNNLYDSMARKSVFHSKEYFFFFFTIRYSTILRPNLPIQWRLLLLVKSQILFEFMTLWKHTNALKSRKRFNIHIKPKTVYRVFCCQQNSIISRIHQFASNATFNLW